MLWINDFDLYTNVSGQLASVTSCIDSTCSLMILLLCHTAQLDPFAGFAANAGDNLLLFDDATTLW